LGVELVGVTSIIFLIIVCTPPVLICIFGLPSVGTPQPPIEWQSVAWLKLLTCIMWNTAGFDDAGALAAEVHTPSHVFPRALAVSLVLVIGLYVATLEVATSVAPDGDSYLVRAGVAIGGPAFGLVVILAAVISTMGQLNSLMCCSTREVVCMATQDRGPVPRIFATLHPRYGTPVFSILAYGFLLLPMLSHSLTDLIADTIFIDCCTFVMQFATWIRFRWETMHLDRVAKEKLACFRLPMGFLGVVIWAICPITLCVVVVILTILEGSTIHLGTFMVVLLMGEILYSKDILTEAMFRPFQLK
jgi:amino acid transporter